MAKESIALLALLMSRGAGGVTVQRALAIARSRGMGLTDLIQLTPHSLARALPSGSEALAEPIAEARRHIIDAAFQIKRTKQAGAEALFANAPGYPRALLDMEEQAPPLLFCSGNASLLSEPVAAIVGTRNPSPQGIELAARCAGLFAAEGIGVVSGGAEGIDTIAHRAALEAGGKTVVVLPQGILSYHPPEFMGQAILDGQAAVVSQFLPTALWATHAAVTRNATIAALARLVCVIEPRKTGGSARTGRCALDSGKPVFCCGVPTDSPDSPLHLAGAKPLADDAGALRTVDLLESWLAAAQSPRKEVGLF